MPVMRVVRNTPISRSSHSDSRIDQSVCSPLKLGGAQQGRHALLVRMIYLRAAFDQQLPNARQLAYGGPAQRSDAVRIW